MLVFKYVLTKVMKRPQYVLMMWSLKGLIYMKLAHAKVIF